MTAGERYTGDAYVNIHQNWHLGDSEGKAAELAPLFRALPEALAGLTVVDVGTGAGGVPHALSMLLAPDSPTFVGYEISEHAIRLGRDKFGDAVELRQRSFGERDGPFDVVMFIDVLEHLENPWEMLRHARGVARYMVVRQPLLDNFGVFRHDKYRAQRDELGHITFFNHRSFLDIVTATGWKPLVTELLPPWRLSQPAPAGRLRPLKQLATRVAPVTSSFLMEGFYLNALFQAA